MIEQHKLSSETYFAVVTDDGAPAIFTPEIVFSLRGKTLCIGGEVCPLSGPLGFSSLVTPGDLQHQVRDSGNPEKDTFVSKEDKATAKIVAGKHGRARARFQIEYPGKNFVVLSCAEAIELEKLADIYITDAIRDNLTAVIEKGIL